MSSRHEQSPRAWLTNSGATARNPYGTSPTFSGTTVSSVLAIAGDEHYIIIWVFSSSMRSSSISICPAEARIMSGLTAIILSLCATVDAMPFGISFISAFGRTSRPIAARQIPSARLRKPPGWEKSSRHGASRRRSMARGNIAPPDAPPDWKQPSHHYCTGASLWMRPRELAQSSDLHPVGFEAATPATLTNPLVLILKRRPR